MRQDATASEAGAETRQGGATGCRRRGGRRHLGLVRRRCAMVLVWAWLLGGAMVPAQECEIVQTWVHGVVRAAEGTRLWAKVRNTGADDLDEGFNLWFRIAMPDASVVWVGPAEAGGTPAGSSEWVSAEWTFTGEESEGWCHLTARAWAGAYESEWSDEDSCYLVTGAGALTASVLSVWGPAQVERGETAKLWVKVENTGDIALPPRVEAWFLLTYSDASSVWVGPACLAGLQPQQTGWYSADWVVSGNAPDGACRFWASAWVDSRVSEWSGEGACDIALKPGEMTVAVRSLWAEPNMSYSDTNTIWALVANGGREPLPRDARVWFYATELGWVGSASVAGLQPGVEGWCSTALRIREATTAPSLIWYAVVYSASGQSEWPDGASIRVGRQPSTIVPVHQRLVGAAVGNLAKLGGIAIDDTARRAYVASDVTPHVAVVDVDSMALLRTFDTGFDQYMEKRLLLNPVSGMLYVGAREELMQCYDVRGSGSMVECSLFAESVVVDSTSGRFFTISTNGTLEAYDADLNLVGSMTDVPHPGYLGVGGGLVYAVSDVPSHDAGGGVYVYDGSTLALVRRYAMPTALSGPASFILVGGDRIYLNDREMGNPTNLLSTTVILERSSGLASSFTVREFQGQWAVLGDSLYMMCGNFAPGDAPTADGAYGVLQRRGAADGGLLKEWTTDVDTRFFALDALGERALYSATGSSTIGVLDLNDGLKKGEIEVGTVIQGVEVRAADGHLYLRDRLGGSRIHRLDPVSTQVEAQLEPGGWPTEIIVDLDRQELYALLHYQARIIVYSTVTEEVVRSLDLGVTRSRTDAISAMAMDHSRGLLYAVFPETGDLVKAHADGSTGAVSVAIDGYVAGGATGDGLLQVAVSESLGRVYVLLTDESILNAYDGDTLDLLDSVDLTGPAMTACPLHLLVCDDANGRLFVGRQILDTSWLESRGTLPAMTAKVVAVDPDGDAVYVWGVSASASEHEFIIEYDPTLTTPREIWHLRANSAGPYAGLAFDFDRRKIYAGYPGHGVLDVFDLR